MSDPNEVVASGAGGSSAADGPTSGAQARINLPEVLEPLIALPQWVCWRWVLVKGKNGKPNKWTKVPYQPNGRKAKTKLVVVEVCAGRPGDQPAAVAALDQRRLVALVYVMGESAG